MTDSAAQPPTKGTSSSSPAAGAALAVPLTAKQQLAYDLQQQGKSYDEAARLMGISKPVYSKTLVAARKKLGIKAKRTTGAEFKSPETAAAAIDAAADPVAETQRAAIDRVNEQLKAAGVPAQVSDALLRRMRTKYANAVFAARELRTNEILEMLGKKIDLAAFYLDDKVMSEASARDIMLGLGVLIEKRNLLRGEPTAIVSDHERKKLNELAPVLLAEIKRRGLTIEGQVTEKTVTPEPNAAA